MEEEKDEEEADAQARGRRQDGRKADEGGETGGCPEGNEEVKKGGGRSRRKS